VRRLRILTVERHAAPEGILFHFVGDPFVADWSSAWFHMKSDIRRDKYRIGRRKWAWERRRRYGAAASRIGRRIVAAAHIVPFGQAQLADTDDFPVHRETPLSGVVKIAD
jgi:hypothetical protein